MTAHRANVTAVITVGVTIVTISVTGVTNVTAIVTFGITRIIVNVIGYLAQAVTFFAEYIAFVVITMA